LLEIRAETTEIHASAPAEVASTQEHLPVEDIGSGPGEKDHKGIDNGKSVSNHHGIVLISEIQDIFPDAIMFIIHNLLSGLECEHEANSRPLEGIDYRNENKKEEAPVGMVLTHLRMAYLAHLD
jgi:hypothetical protein